jgi:hypothetical protein
MSDEWRQFWDRLAVATEAANRNLHQKQRDIGYGDYFVRFYEVAERIVIFGRVMTEAELFDSESGDIESIDDPAEKQEAIEEVRYTMTALRERHEEGYLYGWCHSTIEKGELGSTHRSWMWPISKELFEAARAVEWDIDLLPDEHRNALSRAYVEWTAQSIRRSAEGGDDHGPR